MLAGIPPARRYTLTAASFAMGQHRRPTLAAPPPDPFGERRRAAHRERLRLLGGTFDFETDSARLLRLVRAAYAQLPEHTLPREAGAHADGDDTRAGAGES
jgi:hypothetical protein